MTRLQQVGTNTYLLDIDIKALSEILGNILICHLRTGRGDEFQKVLSNTKNAINHKGWLDQIAYWSAMQMSIDKNNKGAINALREVDIENCSDSDMLTLYLDVKQDELSLQESTNIIDRILNNSIDESHLLQYSILKGINLHLYGQPTEAIRHSRMPLKDSVTLMPLSSLIPANDFTQLR